MTSPHRFAAAFAAFASLLMLPAAGVRAESSLGEEEKAERRLQFNALVESEAVKARRAADSSQAKPLSVNGGAAIGYDSNPTLDTRRDNDSFYETFGEVEWRRRHEGWGPFGPGTAGLDSKMRYINYESYPSLDYQNYSFGGFADAEIAPRWSAKIDYDLGFLRYMENDALNYRSHRLKPAVVFAPSDSAQHSAYGVAEWKDYDHRKAIDEADLPTNDDRRDLYSEIGWSMRVPAWQKAVFGLSAARKANESNDIFHDFNDYEGWKLSGYVYRSFIERISWVAFAGYDRKEYAGRFFRAGTDLTQADDFYYAGTNVFYRIDKNFQLVLAYSYRQNESNDPGQEYSGSTMTAGFSWSN